ncbi:hypothetical protein [Rhodopseudomonas sp. B29]|uniref:hypothetical protein n=1 Tax=Rhodopseudomonas sp. B29 TaxID=95607 RepID=UPI0003455A22|nr:hypothetical protein [Rhodopseudomonas sp. B29]
MRDASEWTEVGGQAGTTPGGLYADEAGARWYVKCPASDDHARSEVLANRLYRLAGTGVPDTELVLRDGRLAVASARVAGVTLGEVMDTAQAAAVCADFAADAWLANRDVLGADLDNVLIGPGGAVVRIDQGGALAYRARGARKADFGQEVIEFDSLRDPRSNAAGASVFGAMAPHALAASIAKVARLTPAAIADGVIAVYGETPAARELSALLIARQADLVRRTPRGAVAVAAEARR